MFAEVEEAVKCSTSLDEAAAIVCETQEKGELHYHASVESVIQELDAKVKDDILLSVDRDEI